MEQWLALLIGMVVGIVLGFIFGAASTFYQAVRFGTWWIDFIEKLDGIDKEITIDRLKELEDEERNA